MTIRTNRGEKLIQCICHASHVADSGDSRALHYILYLVSPILFVFAQYCIINHPCCVTNTECEPNIICHLLYKNLGHHRLTMLHTFYSPLASWASPYFLRPRSSHSQASPYFFKRRSCHSQSSPFFSKTIFSHSYQLLGQPLARKVCGLAVVQGLHI